MINIASLLPGRRPTPLKTGIFVGVELGVVSARAVLYGKGAYPGYVGKLLVVADTGGVSIFRRRCLIRQ